MIQKEPEKSLGRRLEKKGWELVAIIGQEATTVSFNGTSYRVLEPLPCDEALVAQYVLQGFRDVRTTLAYNTKGKLLQNHLAVYGKR